jgi:S-adenosylmethionine:tRNA ribosyltransferase-isomerase
MFDIEDYDYNLPDELIAQVPLPDRDRSRLLVVDRSAGSIKDRRFLDLPELLLPGDLLVVNDTKVVPARLFGRKESGGRIEILVLESQRRIQEGRDPLVSSQVLQAAQGGKSFVL